MRGKLFPATEARETAAAAAAAATDAGIHPHTRTQTQTQRHLHNTRCDHLDGEREPTLADVTCLSDLSKRERSEKGALTLESVSSRDSRSRDPASAAE